MMGAWCDACGRNFPHDRALKQHYLNSYVHNFCSRCNRDFNTSSSLAQHKSNSSSHNFCGKCGDDCFSVDQLNDHIEEYHWYCQQCNMFVDSGPMLERHYLRSSVHHYCGPCKREFNNAANLDAHLRSAKHVGHTIRCVGCTRMFPCISAMTIHLESGACSSGMTRKTLNNVIRAQDTNHIITERLLTYSDANSEKTIDTWATNAAWNGRSYKCYFCPREFRTLPDLNKHLKSPAHEQKIYKCPKCAVRFTLFSGLVQHVESESCGISRFREVKMAMDRITNNLTRMLT